MHGQDVECLYLSQLCRCTQHQACLKSAALLVAVKLAVFWTCNVLPSSRDTTVCSIIVRAQQCGLDLSKWEKKSCKPLGAPGNAESQLPRRRFCVYAQRLRVDVESNRGLTSCPLRIGDGHPLRARTPRCLEWETQDHLHHCPVSG